MTARRGRLGILAALAAALGELFGCAASAPTAVSEGRPCVGLQSPAPQRVVPLELPATFAAARLSAELPAEVVVSPDGSVGAAAMRTAEYGMLAPFAEETLKRGRFSPGTFENNPAAIRLPVRVPIGTPRHPDQAHAVPEIWLYVAAGQSREARWQLRDSVTSVTLVGHVPRLPAPGSVVVVAPDKQMHTLLTIPASDAPQEIRQTVPAGKVFAGAGQYRVELRGAGSAELALASARFTVADDFRGAVINACEPIVLTRKTGPGN